MNNASNNIGKREKVSTTRVAGQFRGFLCAYVHSYYRILGFFACCRCNPKSKNKSLTLKKFAYAIFANFRCLIKHLIPSLTLFLNLLILWYTNYREQKRRIKKIMTNLYARYLYNILQQFITDTYISQSQFDTYLYFVCINDNLLDIANFEICNIHLLFTKYVHIYM